MLQLAGRVGSALQGLSAIFGSHVTRKFRAHRIEAANAPGELIGDRVIVLQKEELRMPKLSAGIVLFRSGKTGIEVFLVHPGGPFWKNKDSGAWSIAKGEYAAGEDPLAAARREFEEETGFSCPVGNPVPLGEVKQPGGKIVAAFALEGDCAADTIRSNFFELEWPPKSGKRQQFPEVDRAGWFSLPEARKKLLAGQHAFLDRLGESVR
jgi:predicted NUDIX family NTP pyrophosphohydrolase